MPKRDAKVGLRFRGPRALSEARISKFVAHIMPKPSVLLYADSSQNADQLYFGRVDVPDPFISFSAGKKKYAVLNALEFGRVKKESAFDVVLPLEPLMSKARERFADRPVKTAEVIVLLSEQFRIKNF